MVIAVPFSVEGWRAPLAARTREPRPLAQAGQIRPAAPVGAKTGPGGQIDSKDNRPASADSQADRDPGPTLSPDPPRNPEAGPYRTTPSSLPTMNHMVRKVSSDGVITRVAGTGTSGHSGDNGPATDAQLNHPGGVAVTPDGGFLIADYDNHTVRKVSSDGVITRVAGTGSAGHSGDDGPATDAQLNHPGGVAVTSDGGFLIATRSTMRCGRCRRRVW